jgi:hypothetical protein
MLDIVIHNATMQCSTVHPQCNPVQYSQRGGGSGRLGLQDGAWVVQREANAPAFRCESDSALPPRDGWSYNAKLHRKSYRPDPRLTVTLTHEPAALCPTVTIGSVGPAGRVVPDYFGVFTRTEQFSAGRSRPWLTD